MVVIIVIVDVFFFKQKTAYEMRISDWSSDVCSSDLIARTEEAARTIRAILTEANANPRRFKITEVGDAFHVPGTIPGESETQIFLRTSDQRPVSQIGRASCRERVGQYV